MARKITPAELMELVNGGATIEREDPKPIEVTGLDRIVAQISALAEQHRAHVETLVERHRAEIAAQQQILTDAVEKIAGAATGVDFTPVKAVLSRIENNTKQVPPIARPAYEFKVERNARGLISSISAKPENPTLQ